jgi:hypothetical protein
MTKAEQTGRWKRRRRHRSPGNLQSAVIPEWTYKVWRPKALRVGTRSPGSFGKVLSGRVTLDEVVQFSESKLAQLHH